MKLNQEPKAPPSTDKNAPLLDVKPTKPVGTAPASTDTTHAFQLFQQKQYAAAAQEAKQIATADPGNAEAWKLAGFSEFYLKQYEDASGDLQKALDLQRRANQEDSHQQAKPQRSGDCPGQGRESERPAFEMHLLRREHAGLIGARAAGFAGLGFY